MATSIGELYLSFNSNAKSFNKELANVQSQTKKLGNTMTSGVKKIGSFAGALSPISVSSAGATIAIAKLTSESIKLEEALDNTNSILSLSEEQLMSYKDTIQDIAIETGKSSLELTESLYEVVSAGVDVSDSLEFLESSAKAAQVGFATTAQAVDLATSVINAYGLDAENVDELFNKFIETQNRGKVVLSQMAGTLSGVTVTASNLGVSIDQVLAGMVDLTKAGTAPAVAVTQLNRLLVELSDTGGDAAKLLSNLTGKSFKELTEEGMNLGEILLILQNDLKKNNLEFTDLFGRVEAAKGAIRLAKDEAEGFSEALSQVSQPVADFEKAQREVTDNVVGEWKKLKEAIKKEYDELFDTFKEPLTITLRTVRENIEDETARKETGSKITEKVLTFLPDIIAKVQGKDKSVASEAITEQIEADLRASLKDIFESGELDYYKEAQEEIIANTNKLTEETKKASEETEKYSSITADAFMALREVDNATLVKAFGESEKERQEALKQSNKEFDNYVDNYISKEQKRRDEELESQEEFAQNQYNFNKSMNESIAELEAESLEYRYSIVEKFVSQTDQAMNQLLTQDLSASDFSLISELYAEAASGNSEAAESLINLAKSTENAATENNKLNLSTKDVIDGSSDVGRELSNLGDVLDDDLMSSVGSAISGISSFASSVYSLSTAVASGNSFAIVSTALSTLSSALGLFSSDSQIDDTAEKLAELEESRQESEDKFAESVETFQDTVLNDFTKSLELIDLSTSVDVSGITYEDLGINTVYNELLGEVVGGMEADLTTLQDTFESFGMDFSLDELQELVDSTKEVLTADVIGASLNFELIEEEELLSQVKELITTTMADVSDEVYESLGLDSASIASSVISGFESGDVSSALTDQFNSAMQTAMLQSFGMQDLYQAYGDAILKEILAAEATAGMDFSVDNLDELTSTEIADLIVSATDELSVYLESLGVSIDENTDSTDSLTSTIDSENLSETSKLQARIFDATEGVGTIVTNQMGQQISIDLSGSSFGTITMEEVETAVSAGISEAVGTRSWN